MNLKPCMPGYNKPRMDFPRVEIGQTLRGEVDVDGDNTWVVKDERFIRDGMLGSGHSEFFCIRMKPKSDTRNEAWFPEYLLQEYTTIV